MNEIEAYETLISILNNLQPYSIDLTTDRIKSVLEKYGNPQNAFFSIIVGGTNGKGSVCQFLTDAFIDSGMKTGTYTSPHLIQLNERFRINNRPVCYANLLDSAYRIQKSHNSNLTYFEFLTVMAFDIFQKEKIDVAVLEVGMGGEFDATNTVNPALSIITSISKDHTEYLGKTYQAIAKTKSKIIKNIGVIGKNNKIVIDTIKQYTNAKLFFVDSTCIQKAKSMKITMQGCAAKENLATAILAVHVLNKTYGFTLNYNTFKKSFWPGRFEIIKTKNKTFILDGAHNEGATYKLVESLKDHSDKAMIFATLKSKQWKNNLKLLTPYMKKIILAPISNHRLSEKTDYLNDFISNTKETIICKNINEAVNLSFSIEEKTIVITGSLYLIGEAKACRIYEKFIP